MPRTSPRLVLAAVRAAARALWRAARAAVLPGAVAALAGAPAVAAPPVFAITSIAEGCLARFLNDKAQTVVVCGEEYLWTPGEGMKPIADPPVLERVDDHARAEQPRRGHRHAGNPLRPTP
ncbi:hypothetical protein [Ideonella sp.]|uniref:hypothetical protein n=1 Tax=Ideonella sp. TaxID=1929293 RepID=UPI0035B1CF9C